MRHGLAALTMVLLAAGCSGLVPEPPAATPGQAAPPVLKDAPEAAGIVRVRVPGLSRDGFRRRAERLTARVRNLSCKGLGTGSAFAIDRTTLVTNRHVVAGAEALEVNTSDGRTLEVSAAEVGVLGDIALVTVDEALPVVADVDGRAPDGAEIAAVGYPLGGPVTITEGMVIDHIDGGHLGVPGPVIRIDAALEPGNSGGPLLDRRGRVAGVVYAEEVATGLGLAMPISTVRALLEEGGTTSVPDCGLG